MNTHYETAAASVHYGTQQQCMQLTKHHVSEHKLHNTAAVSTRYRTQPPRTYITKHSSSECTLQSKQHSGAECWSRNKRHSICEYMLHVWRISDWCISEVSLGTTKAQLYVTPRRFTVGLTHASSRFVDYCVWGSILFMKVLGRQNSRTFQGLSMVNFFQASSWISTTNQEKKNLPLQGQNTTLIIRPV